MNNNLFKSLKLFIAIKINNNLFKSLKLFTAIKINKNHYYYFIKQNI